MDSLELYIPPGHTPLNEWRDEHDGELPPDEILRYKDRYLALVLDATDPEYQALQAQCKADTKALERALRQEIRERELPVWTPYRSRPKYAKGHRRINFMIRPPFVSSRILGKGEIRTQGDFKKDDFCLHFGRDHKPDEIRFWTNGSPEGYSLASMVNTRVFRNKVAQALWADCNFMQNQYGNWEAVAGKICDIFEKLHIEKYAAALNQPDVVNNYVRELVRW